MTNRELQKLQQAAQDETRAHLIERNMVLLEAVAAAMLDTHKPHEVAAQMHAFALIN